MRWKKGVFLVGNHSGDGGHDLNMTDMIKIAKRLVIDQITSPSSSESGEPWTAEEKKPVEQFDVADQKLRDTIESWDTWTEEKALAQGVGDCDDGNRQWCL